MYALTVCTLAKTYLPYLKSTRPRQVAPPPGHNGGSFKLAEIQNQSGQHYFLQCTHSSLCRQSNQQTIKKVCNNR